MNPNFIKYLLEITNASAGKEIEIIQELWSGYGKIARFKLEHSEYKKVVVKHIFFKKANEHPRGWNTNFSHQRKVKSYEVETNWYKNWNQKCTENCKTPHFIGAFATEYEQWIVLEDLNEKFPLRKEELKLSEIKVCLKWLANFHARFLNEKPVGLWKIGTYWHLETRPDEYKKIQDVALKAKAHLIDETLNQCKFQTLVHGDAKLANFCFSENGKNVAAVDFQYVGAGCGMKDVAYFLGSCLSGSESEVYEKELLDFYFIELQKAIKQAINCKDLEQEWRKMYDFACADFTRFMLGWMPTHQKINSYNLDKVNAVLACLALK